MSHKIIEAVRHCQYSQLSMFLKHNYNFKIKSPHNGNNILMVALEIPKPKRRMKMLKYLLDLDLVNVLENNNYGQDLFFIAVKTESEAELKFLMKNYHTEIDWSKRDNLGNTLLHYSVITNNLNILQLLLNYCAKYKVNVDIPDSYNKITPYLLACRLNHQEAADLLINIGNASKNQSDQWVFFDAERWKKEGQIEKIESFLKEKKEEMELAKLYGKIRVYQELTEYSEILDNEYYKYPDILPILNQVISNDDKSFNHKSINQHKSQKASVERPNVKFTDIMPKDTFEPVILSPKSSCSNSNNIIKKSDNLTNEKDTIKNQILPDINKIFKNQTNKNDKFNEKSELFSNVESLMEMSENVEPVANFFGSKPNASTLNKISSVNLAQLPYRDIKCARYLNHSSNLNSVSDIFTEASLQRSNNYRAPARKIEILKLKKINKELFNNIDDNIYRTPKGKFSTLAVLREESQIITKEPKKKCI